MSKRSIAGEVRGLRDVRSVLVITGLLGVVLLLVQLLDLLPVIDDLGIELRLLRLLVSDRRLQARNLLVELFDRVLLVVGLLLAEARELVIGRRLRLAVRFDLGLELLKKSRHLLDGVHFRLLLGVSLQGCNERQEENALHGWFTRKLSVTPRKSNP